MRCTGDVTLQYLVLIFVLKRPHEMLGGGDRGLIIWRPSERNEEKASMVCGSGPSDRPLLTSWHFGSRVSGSGGGQHTRSARVPRGATTRFAPKRVVFRHQPTQWFGGRDPRKGTEAEPQHAGSLACHWVLFFCKEKGLSQPQVFVFRQLDSSGFLKLTSHRVMLKSNSENVGIYRLSK